MSLWQAIVSRFGGPADVNSWILGDLGGYGAMAAERAVNLERGAARPATRSRSSTSMVEVADSRVGRRDTGPHSARAGLSRARLMLQLTPYVRLLACVEPIDFRNGIDELVRQVHS